MQSLLPKNATQLEKDLERAMGRLELVPVHINRTLWNPDACPENLLPWLAWALSVDEWDNRWPEDIKRNVIKASVPLHRIKGTRRSVDMALSALEVGVELTEWFDMSPAGEPYSFELLARITRDIFADSNVILSPEYYETIRRIVNATKSARSGYVLKLGVDFKPVGIGSASAASTTAVRIGAAEPTQHKIHRFTGVRFGAGAQSTAVAKRRTEHQQGKISRFSELRTGASASSVAVCRVRCEVRQGPVLSQSQIGAAGKANALGMVRASFKETNG